MTPSATFAEKLAAAAERNRSWLCVGLDPQPGRTPLDEIVPFTRAIIDATSDLVCAFKPQAAFFEAHGRAGWDALAATIAAVPDHVPVVLDVKRGDIGHVAEAYATACFDALGADAVTVNPYLGRDAVAPFLARPDKGAFILCRTSNAGGADLQSLDVGGEPLFLRVASLVQEWGAEHHNAGLVVGATYPRELAAVRDRAPGLPILLPGIGAQGGDLEASVRAGGGGGGLLVSASRSVIYAGAGPGFATAARAEAERLRAAISSAINGANSSAPASD